MGSDSGLNTKNHIFVQFAGGAVCEPPAPRIGCHRYAIIGYKNSWCLGVRDDLANSSDTKGHFDGWGIYDKCALQVTSSEIRCFSGADAEPCLCPGAGFSVDDTKIDKYGNPVL